MSVAGSPVLSATYPYVVVWVLLVFAWMTNFTIRVGFSALLPPVMRELDLTYTAAGVLASAYFYAYGFLQLPAGVLGDRFGRRRILLIGLVVGAVACASTGLVGTFVAIFVARMFTGAAHATLFSNDRAIIAAVTPPEKLALGQAVSFSGPGLGLLLGLALGGVLGERLSWRITLGLFALGPLVAALLVARFVPASPLPAEPGRLRTRVASVLGARALWIIGAASACGIYVQFQLATWGPSYFVDIGVQDLGLAGAYAGTQGPAAIAGLVVGGWLGDVMHRRGVGRRIMMAASLCTLAVSTLGLGLALARYPSPWTVGLGLVLASFCVWSTWGPAYALVAELTPASNVATAFGLCNSLSFVGAMLGPAIAGVQRDATGSFSSACQLSAVVAAAGALIALAVRVVGGGRPPMAPASPNV